MNSKRAAGKATKPFYQTFLCDVLYVLLFTLTTVLALYRREGYYALGEAKYRLFLLAVGVTVLLFVAVLAARLIRVDMTKGTLHPAEWRNSDTFFCICAISCTISFFLAADQNASLTGAYGWRMGYVTQMLCLFLYAAYAQFFRVRAGFRGILLAGPCVVSFVAILNRFGIRLDRYHLDYDAGFLSTIGNVNWLTGFLCVFLPVAMAFFMKEAAPKRFAANAMTCSVLLFTALIQGSDSIVPVIGVSYLALLFAAVQSRVLWQRYLQLLLFLGCGLEGLFLCGMMAGESVTGYLKDTMLYRAAALQTGIPLILLAGILLLLNQKREWVTFKKQRHEIIVVVLACIILTACLAAGIIGMISAVRIADEVTMAGTDALAVHGSWGNGRGAIYALSILMLREFSPLQWLFGVGPDGYAAFLRTVPSLQGTVEEYYGSSVLTNAHCVLLTRLINEGLAGVTAYYGFFISIFITLGRRIRREVHLMDLAAFAAICSYLANGMVSFEQILSLPYLMIVTGIARSEPAEIDG